MGGGPFVIGPEALAVRARLRAQAHGRGRPSLIRQDPGEANDTVAGQGRWRPAGGAQRGEAEAAVHGGVAAGTRPRGRLRGKGRAELREHAGERVPSRTIPARGQRGIWGWRSQGVAGDWAAGREEEDGDAGDVGEAVRRGGLRRRRRARGGRSGRIGGARRQRWRSGDGVVGRGSPATMGRRRAPASGSGARGSGRGALGRPRSRSRRGGGRRVGIMGKGG